MGSFRKLLETRCPEAEFRDDDIEKLVAQGISTSFTLALCSKDELLQVLPGRLGIVNALVKTFGEAPRHEEPPSKRRKTKSPEAESNFYKALLEDQGELPQTVEEINEFLSKRPIKFPVLPQFWSTLGLNVKNLLHPCSNEDEVVAELVHVQSALQYGYGKSPNEATSSARLFYLTGHFLELLNKIAPVGCTLHDLETSLDSADLSSKSASSALISESRPDFLLYVQQVLMLRWENKIDPSEMQLARDENVEKLKVWSPLYYGSLPYVIGGCCGGASFMWLKLSPDGDKIKVENLVKYDLSTDLGVALLLYSTARMHCLLQKLQNKLPALPPNICLYKPMIRDNGGEVVVYPYKVVKKVIPKLDVETVTKLYDSITSSSYLIQLSHIRNRSACTELELKPVGDPNSRPTNLKDLGNATHDLLHGLVDLHKVGYTHRDLRWDNCIKVDVQGEWKWVLIDLEAAGCDEENWVALRGWDKKMLADCRGKKLYTKESDIYQLGKLILEWLESDGKSGEEAQAMRAQGETMQEQRPAAAKILEEFCKNGCRRCGKFDKFMEESF